MFQLFFWSEVVQVTIAPPQETSDTPRALTAAPAVSGRVSLIGPYGIVGINRFFYRAGSCSGSGSSTGCFCGRPGMKRLGTCSPATSVSELIFKRALHPNLELRNSASLVRLSPARFGTLPGAFGFITIGHSPIQRSYFQDGQMARLLSAATLESTSNP